MIKVITTATGETINLRYDLGTARLLKAITKADPISGEENTDFQEKAADIFLAGYQRSFQVVKQPQLLPDAEAREIFFELELSEAIEIVKAFTGVLSVAPDPTKPAAEPAEGEEPKKY